MAAIQARQPFAALDSTRLQKLGSVKNTQNSITAALQASKQALSSPGKRTFSDASIEDTFDDAENLDPEVFNSPSKRSKQTKFLIVEAPGYLPPVKKGTLHLVNQAATSISKKPLSLSVPNTTTTTPISASRGSPKHKRVGILNKNRRASSSPFRRIDPPTFNSTPTGLPFSIDEALKGTITGYTPKSAPAAVSEPAPPPAPVVDVHPVEHMPKTWFFSIHEDTPDQEAANLMEHSASTLDISSDDDMLTRSQREMRERGKENIPPPPNFLNMTAAEIIRATTFVIAEDVTATPALRPTKRNAHPDAMLEDRNPLGELNVEDFYDEGLNESSKVVVPAEVVSTPSSLSPFSPQKPSGLSKEFDFA
ncbi:hypothetical protein NA57DRAFT_25592, partial [Rhizodiscina lignyota]